jgi:hypothetical protein
MREPQIPTKVHFLTEWMGNPPGSYKIFWSNLAKDLERRGILEIVPSESSISALNNPLLKKDEKKVEVERKLIRKPTRDKMVRISKDK